MNIAICDDRPMFRKMLETMIQVYEARHNTRFRICQFDSGEELIEKIGDSKVYFDLIFLDQHMKELSGFETALCVRKYYPACNIVFCTASDSLCQFASASPLAILQKPVNMEDVYAILDKIRTDNIAAQLL